MTPRPTPISLGAIAALSLTSACSRAAKPDAYGNIEATEVVVGSQTSGQLVSYTPAEGNHIVAGTLVAVVDTTTPTLQLRQIAAERAAAGSRVNEVSQQVGVLETQRAIAERQYERTRRLFAEQAATAQQLDQAERDYRTLVAQINATRAQRQTATVNVAASDARVAQLRDAIAKSRVTNPITGTVLTTYAKAGEFVQMGQPLYKIANLDTVELRAYVTETQLGTLRVGQRVTVTVDAAGQRRSLPGTVSWVASTAEFTPTPIETRDERQNLVYAVKITLANPNGLLKIGMPADVMLATAAPRAMTS